MSSNATNNAVIVTHRAMRKNNSLREVDRQALESIFEIECWTLWRKFAT